MLQSFQLRKTFTNDVEAMQDYYARDGERSTAGPVAVWYRKSDGLSVGRKIPNATTNKHVIISKQTNSQNDI